MGEIVRTGRPFNYYKACIRTAFTRGLPMKLRALYDVPEYQMKPELKAAMDGYGIRKVFADPSAQQVLEDTGIIYQITHGTDKPLRTNLFLALKDTGVKMIFDEDIKVIYFLKDAQFVRLYPHIGYTAGETGHERSEYTCPSRPQMIKFSRNKLKADEAETLKAHLYKCPYCVDYYNMLMNGEDIKPQEDLEV